jgi:hypothetical protein
MGFALFTRLPRGVELTAAGAAFVDDAGAVLAALERGVINATKVANGQLGLVRIALTFFCYTRSKFSSQTRKVKSCAPTEIGLGISRFARLKNVSNLLHLTLNV